MLSCLCKEIKSKLNVNLKATLHPVNASCGKLNAISGFAEQKMQVEPGLKPEYRMNPKQIPLQYSEGV